MKPFTLRQAAAEAGVDKMTIQRAIKRGDLSASRQRQGGPYQIDPAELFRVYPRNDNETEQKGTKRRGETFGEPRSQSALEREIEIRDMQLRQLETAQERERALMHETIDDLRGRLDRELQERARLTLVLTDQRERSEKRMSGSFFNWFRRRRYQ